MKSGLALPNLFEEVKMRMAAKRQSDLVLPAERCHFETEKGNVVLVCGDRGPYHLTPHFESQMRTDLNDQFRGYARPSLGLTADYWHSTKAMGDGDGNLLVTNVNALLERYKSDGRNKLVRCYDYKWNEIPGRDNVARAWLSDQFNRLDYEDLLQSVLPLILPMYEQGKLLFRSCDVTDTKLYIKFTVPSLRREVKISPRVGEVVDFGGILQTSEVGSGANEAVLFYEVLTCTNGAKATKYGQVRRHTGKRISATEEHLYSEKVIRLDDQAFWAKFQEDTQALLNGVYAQKMVDDMERAAGVQIPHAGKAVDFLKNKWDLTNDQADSVLNYFVKGGHGGMTLYGLSNAVTRAAEDQEDYDLATLFEERGADLLTTLTRTELQEIVKR